MCAYENTCIYIYIYTHTEYSYHYDYQSYSFIAVISTIILSIIIVHITYDMIFCMHMLLAGQFIVRSREVTPRQKSVLPR